MFSLMIEDDHGDIRKVVVDKDVFSIGRAPDNDLVLSDVNVSRHHARLENRAIGVVLVDPGSTYGIRMNGLRAPQETLLQGGDLFVLGDYKFELAPHEGAAEPSRSTTSRMSRVREQSSSPADSGIRPVPGMEGQPGVHYTVALSEDESLKILLQMRRNMVSDVRSGDSPQGFDDIVDDDAETSQAESRSRRLGTVFVIILVGALLLLGWLVYSTLSSSAYDRPIGLGGHGSPAIMGALDDDPGIRT